MNPVCVVRIPIQQMIRLLAPATSHPCHILRPTSKVDTMVSTHEM